MGIRDIIMLILGCACVPLALYDAYYGLLAYCWLSFMRPQTFVWAGSVETARITFAVGAAMIFRALFSRGPRVQWRLPTFALVAVWFWFGVATFASSYPETSREAFVQFSKIGVASLLVTGLVRTREHLIWLFVLLALCPGVYGTKLGVFFLRGGTEVLAGGPLGMDNNDTAMFIAMGVPLLVFAAPHANVGWLRNAFYAAAILSVPGVIATTSRGGILTLAAALGLTVWRKTTWWKALAVGAATALLVFAVVPEKTEQRYRTVREYEQDQSAMGRIAAWRTAMAMAADHPATGVGFGQDAYMREYERYKVVASDRPRAAHSVWFSLLAETGYVGLGLYALLLGSALVATRRVMTQAKRRGMSRSSWAWDFAAGIQCAVIAFAVGGTFLSQARFEFIFVLCALTVPVARIAELELAVPAAVELPRALRTEQRLLAVGGSLRRA